MTGRTRFGHNVIDTDNIYADAIDNTLLADDAVQTENIKDDNVTTDKLAPGVLTQNVRDMVKTAAILKTTGTIPICTIPAGSYVYRVITSARIGFDGSTSINIGDAGDTDGFLPTANITKTLAAVSGEDPATYGVYLWVPGVISGGDWTYTPGTLSGGDWEVTANPTWAQNGTDPYAVTSITKGAQTKTAASLGAGSQVKTAATVTTYGHQRVKYYAADTVINATVVAGSSTVGTLDVYIHYMRTVMAD